MIKKSAILATILTSFICLGAPSAYAANSGNPAGNNGTIKINDEVAPGNIPNNHPHVECTFSVDFYNYDKGDYKASVAFELQAPTTGDNRSLSVTGDLRPFIGGDTAGGGTDLDASQKYKLSFTGSPHAQQGYHVKVTVHAPGSQGSDKKSKVFWVQPCKPASPTAPTPTTTPKTLGTSTNQPGELPHTGPSLLPVLSIASIVSGLGYLLHFLRHRPTTSN